MTEKSKIINLINTLNNASNAYYNLDDSIMTDYEYDKLYDELVELEKTTSIFMSNSPTRRVGFDVVDKFTRVEHKAPMLSLDKTKSFDELVDFLGDNIGLLSWKLDGLTVVLEYIDGQLVSAVTRGNGTVGEDITHNAKVFANVPLKLNESLNITVRGEAIIDFETFQAINDKLILKGEEPYKNPRNLCSGSVRQLNSKITSERKVKFIAFGLIDSNIAFENKSDSLKWLAENNFDTVEYKTINKNSIEDEFNFFKNKVTYLEFATDGLVLTYDNISYSNSLGKTSKFPKDSIAFKWKDEVATTTLIDVEWNTSRAGTINPIAIFEPVNIEGTEVERASLHNLTIFESFELGVGDTISVYKANMIIPQVLDNETRSNTLKAPETCGACGTKTEIQKANETAVLLCPNPSCGAKQLYSFIHFVSRNAMNITGFSQATIEKFITLGYLNNFVDIYTLENYKDEIVNLKGFGEKSYIKLQASIEESRNVKLENFIFALGISNVGLSTAKTIIQKLNVSCIEEFLELDFDRLVNVEGVGDIVAKNILDYTKNITNNELVLNLASKLNILVETKVLVESKVTGKSFVITGSLEHYKNRNELQEEIEKLGGTVASSIKKDTDYLINNDINSNSSKNKSAKDKNIPIITEEQFIELFIKE